MKVGAMALVRICTMRKKEETGVTRLTILPVNKEITARSKNEIETITENDVKHFDRSEFHELIICL